MNQALYTMSLSKSQRGSRKLMSKVDREILSELIAERHLRSRSDMESEYWLRGGDMLRFDYLYEELMIEPG